MRQASRRAMHTRRATSHSRMKHCTTSPAATTVSTISRSRTSHNSPGATVSAVVRSFVNIEQRRMRVRQQVARPLVTKGPCIGCGPQVSICRSTPAHSAPTTGSGKAYRPKDDEPPSFMSTDSRAIYSALQKSPRHPSQGGKTKHPPPAVSSSCPPNLKNGNMCQT